VTWWSNEGGCFIRSSGEFLLIAAIETCQRLRRLFSNEECGRDLDNTVFPLAGLPPNRSTAPPGRKRAWVAGASRKCGARRLAGGEAAKGRSATWCTKVARRADLEGPGTPPGLHIRDDSAIRSRGSTAKPRKPGPRRDDRRIPKPVCRSCASHFQGRACSRLTSQV